MGAEAAKISKSIVAQKANDEDDEKCDHAEFQSAEGDGDFDDGSQIVEPVPVEKSVSKRLKVVDSSQLGQSVAESRE